MQEDQVNPTQKPPVSAQEFSKKIKAKYPEYKDVDDVVLAQKMIEKYPEYKTQVFFDEVKKKDNSVSSTTNQKLASEETIGSSGGVKPTSKTPLDINKRQAELEKALKNVKVTEQNMDLVSAQTDELSAIKKLRKANEQAKTNKRVSELETDFYKNTVSKDDDAIAEQRTKDAINQNGIWNNIKAVSKKAYNKTVGGLAKLVDEPGINDLKVSTDPLADEKKIVQAEALKNKEKLSEEEINQRATAVFKQKEKDNLFIDRANFYLDNLDGKDKELLRQDRTKKTMHLSEDNDKRLKVTDALKSVATAKIAEYKAVESELQKLKEANKPFPEDVYQKYQSLGTEIQGLGNQIEKNQSYIQKNNKDLGTAEQELDLFNREYGDIYNFGGNFSAATGELANGLLGFGGYVNSIYGDLTGNLDAQMKGEAATDASINNSKSLEEFRKTLRTPVESLESVEGFVNYASDLVSNQLPMLMATSTGAGGLAAIGASSSGQKFAEMNTEQRKGANYNAYEMAFAPLLYGGAEVISEIPTLAILKKGGRVIESAVKNETNLISRTLKEKAKTLAKDYAVDMTKEMSGEQFTNFVQNFNDKYVLGKSDVGLLDNTGKVFKDTFTLTTMLKVAPHVAGAVLKTVQTKDQLGELDENARKIIEFSKQLETPGLTATEKTVIQKQIDKATTSSAKIMKSTIDKVGNMPDLLYDEVVSLNSQAGEIKAQARAIFDGDLDNKDVLLKGLQDDYKAIQDSRKNILDGNTTQVDVLPLKEQDAIKKEALQSLTAELNPDGTKNITITNEQIIERANELLENPDPVSETKQEPNEDQKLKELKDFLDQLDPEEKVEVQDELDNSPTIKESIDATNTFTLNGEEGVLKIEGQQVVFETKTSINELGNVDEISESKLLEFGIEPVQELDIEVNDDYSVQMDGKSYVNPNENPSDAIVIGKNGEYSVNLVNDKGEKRTIRGQKAEQIAYNYKLKEIENGTEGKIDQATKDAEAAIADEANSVQQEDGDTEQPNKKRRTKRQRSLKQAKEPLTKSESEEIELNNLIEAEKTEKEKTAKAEKEELDKLILEEENETLNQMIKEEELSKKDPLFKEYITLRDKKKKNKKEQSRFEKLDNVFKNKNLFDEKSQENNSSSNGSVQPRTNPVGEVVPAEPKSAPKENVPEPADGGAVEKGAEVIAAEQDEFDNLLSGEAEKRRKDGRYSRDGVEFVRQEESFAPTGKKDTVKFTDKNEVAFEYTLMEANEVQPSHINGKRNPLFFITEAQPKNRKDDASKKASDEIGKNPKLKEAGENSNAYSGAPVVNARGEVIQGNNRAEGLKKHYSNKGKSYKEQLKADAAKYGFTAEQIDAMENPILVRKVSVEDNQAIELGNYDVKDLETGGTRRLDPITTSRRIPKSVKSKIIDLLFKDNSDLTLNQALRKSQVGLLGILKSYMNDAQMNTIVRNDGTMRPNGIEDLEKLVQHFLFDGGNVNLAEQFESLSGIAREGILKSLPKLLSVSSAKSIITEIQNAIGAYHAFKQSGVESFQNWLTQADMFNENKTPSENYTELEIEIANILNNAKTQKEIKTIFDLYSNKVNDFEGDMFEPAREGSDKKEAVKEIFKINENGREENENQRNDGRPKEEVELPKGGEKGSGKEKPKSKIDLTLEQLNQWENDLDQFGRENLSMGIPLVVAKGAIQAMKAALKAGKLATEVLQAGLDYVRNTQWFKALSQTEQSNIESDFQANFLNQINAIDPKNDRQAENLLNRAASESISEEEAYNEVNEAFDRSNAAIENKKPFREAMKNLYRSYVKKFTDRQFSAKMLLGKSGLMNTKNLMINAHGASGLAKMKFQEAYDKIYKGLNAKNRLTLDKIIQARRFIAIDTNREARGLEPVTHPSFIDKNKSEKFLSRLEAEIGSEAFADLNTRAEAYFDTYKTLLDEMLDNGLISQESYDSMQDVDYQPRVFLQFVTDFNGDLGEGNKQNNLDSGGLSADQIKSMKEGDASDLVLKSEWLLTNSLLARSRAMAVNNINKRFMTDEFPKAKARFDALDPKNLKGDDVRFYKYFKELESKIIDNPNQGLSKSGKPKYKYDKTPMNFQKAYYYIDGKQHQFFIEKELHEAWFDNVEGIMGSKTKEFLSYATGSALVKGIATGNNPAFPIVNTPRDFLFTITFSDQYSSFIPKAMGQIAKDVAKSIKEIKKSDSEVLRKYMEYGGAMDFLSSQGKLKKTSVVGKVLQKAIDPKARDTFKKVFDTVTLHKISQYSEMMFRLGIFQRSINNQLKELGFADIADVSDKKQVDDIYNQAVANARGILDFNQGGSVTKDLESVIPYINVAFQGGRVAASAFEKNPTQATAKILQVATIASAVPVGISMALLSMMKPDEDKDKSVYDIYLNAMEGVSAYQKSKYMNIVLPFKNEDGEYMVVKIAKAQELSPIMSVTDDIYMNMIRSMAGKDKKSAGRIVDDAAFTFNSNVMPIDFTSPAGLITRTPAVKAVLTYQTGYDFFRDQPLSNDIGKVPLPVEGANMRSTEDFYKKIGENFGLSPIRTKAFVESMITSPSTNPFVGMLYGGADAASSDKDMKQIGKEFATTIGKSTLKRVVSYPTDFNRQLATNDKLQDQIDNINIEKYKTKAKFADLTKQFIAKEITEKELVDEVLKLDPNDQKTMVNRIKDKIRMQDVDGSIIDIKYEQGADVKALMIMHYYGDITDGSEDSKQIVAQMKRAKGVLTESVIFEYEKLLKQLKSTKKRPD